MSDNIKVVVKVRPLISREIEDKLKNQWRVNNNTISHVDNGSSFTFDKVYDEDTKTEEIYNDVAKPIVEAALSGFNGTIFAYGQTSSGKTYTMTGTESSPGIIPLAVLSLFDFIKNLPGREFLVKVSYVEIYNENLKDLLDLKKTIKITETFHGIKVDATEKVTTCPKEILEVMERGKANRQTGATNMNEESSRSHSIFQITIESREHTEEGKEAGPVNVSQLNLVDLAGSERAGQTGATGIRFKEGTLINKSLLSLALVIKQLSEVTNHSTNKHINYRDSKLTRILQNSLGGNAKTSIICAVTPACVEETISTLQFASRAKAIKNSPAVNVVAADVTTIQNLTKQLSTLKTQLESKKNVEQNNHILQNKITCLESLILNGFVQRSNVDLMCGTRRKLNPLRRVTISTLHSIEEDHGPLMTKTIPKFCTPSLKYNPHITPGAADFLPALGKASLPIVVEEARAVTPPPRDRRVNFNEEVIEIDSDEESVTQPCSPYHKCYDSSKTPPCILRKNAKIAEKNFKDIVELTEREKLYEPEIVELMKKLENKELIIAKLEDDVNRLKRKGEEGGVEVERLSKDIVEAEKEVSKMTSAMENLEKLCRDYETKLTDSEVSYESLKNKYKNREQELLSLLQDKSTKKTYETTGINTSFVDNGSQIKEDTDEKPDLITQLLFKDQTILELQAAISAQETKIESLENTNKEFQEMIYKFQATYNIEVENLSNVATIEKLNAVIEEHKSLIDSIITDNESYKSVIQELQLKLSEKDKMFKEFITVIDMDNILKNEEILVENNDNLQNVVESLKVIMNNNKEELERKQFQMEQSHSKKKNDILKELETSKENIFSLNEEIKNLQLKFDESCSNLIQTQQERDNLEIFNHKLNTIITEMEDEKNILQIQNETYKSDLVNLKKSYDDKELDEKRQARELVQQENNSMSNKIILLEKDIDNKNKYISSLEQIANKSEIHIQKAQSTAKKLHEIMSLLTQNTKELPIIIDDVCIAFTMFEEILNGLETAVVILIKQNKELSATIEIKDTECKTLQYIIDEFSKNINDFGHECEITLQAHCAIQNNENQLINLLHINNNIDCCDNLKNNMRSITHLIKTTYTTMTQNLQEKDGELNKLRIKNEAELQDVVTKLLNFENENSKQHEYLYNILQKCLHLNSCCDNENKILCELETNMENVFETILMNLDKISNHINLVKAIGNNEKESISASVAKTKQEIMDLTQENLKLLATIKGFEEDNHNLSKQLSKINNENLDLIKDIQKSNDILNSIKQNFGENAKEFNDGFTQLDISVKERINQLEIDNYKLLLQLTELKSQTDLKISTSNDSTINFNNSKVIQNSNSHVQLNIPPSLVTICYNRIYKIMDQDCYEKSLCESSTSESTMLENSYQYEKLLIELDAVKHDNDLLNERIKYLESENEYLSKDQDLLKNEVQLLIESSNELQKKIINHRTNLSTLTATTYAENKSLCSQIKFLQHYYSRFYNVCQKDIPDFKKQLQDLLVLLNSESFNKHNDSIKRYSLPNTLDSTEIHSTFRNESILDGDLLMLDTNVSLTTCDNTLLGQDQTGIDVTQMYLCNEVGCQTSFIEHNLSNILHSQVKSDDLTEQNIHSALQALKDENAKLRELVDDYSEVKQCNSIKTPCMNKDIEEVCIHAELLSKAENELKENINIFSQKLLEIEAQKADIEHKYNKLNLNETNTEALLRKLKAFEKEISTKQDQIDTLTSSLKEVRQKMENLQEENDGLSDKIMDYLSEVDNLKKEQELLKIVKTDLTNQCTHLEKEIEVLKSTDNYNKNVICSECKAMENIINDLKLRLTTSTYARLNRSYSDSESASRFNKICTLQTELHAGREDCIELKEEVTTIKNHLEGSPKHLDMDLDVSMAESQEAILSADVSVITNFKNDDNLGNISDNYALEKINCYNYYMEKVDGVSSTLGADVKIIDIMKMLYENLIVKHSNDIENLRNRLKDFEENKELLETEIKDLKRKSEYLEMVGEAVMNLKNNLKIVKDTYNEPDFTINFKDKFLYKIDQEFGFNVTPIFDSFISFISDKHEKDIRTKEENNHVLLEELETAKADFININDQLSNLKTKFYEKESNYNLLLLQKQGIQEISNAVTLDIINKDRELREIVMNIHEEMVQTKILHENEIDFNLPLHDIINMLFKHTISHNEKVYSEKLSKEKDQLVIELADGKCVLADMEKLLLELKEEYDIVKSQNVICSTSLNELEGKLHQQNSLHRDLQEIYGKKVEENNMHITTIEKITGDIDSLKEIIMDKDITIKKLETQLENQTKQNNLDNQSKLTDILHSATIAQKEIEDLKHINQLIIQEKNTLNKDLEEAGIIINNHKLDLEKVNNDIIILKDSINENNNILEQLREEAKTLHDEKTQLKFELQEKCLECSQLFTNMKTYEKSAEIQNKMINKWRQQKEDAERVSRDKDAKLEELSERCKQLQEECEKLGVEMKAAKEEINNMKSAKDLLESRVTELEVELEEKRGRLSVGSADTSRRRRQSIHDSKRMFTDAEEELRMEAVFRSRTPTDDMFMDVDERSTPLRTRRGRDSLSSSRHDQSEREEDVSRAGRARDRRRSTHDLRRTLPLDGHNNVSHNSSSNTSVNSDLHQVKRQLATCQEELAELKEKYRELDEECETCAECLRERDEQCARLKKDKTQLEHVVQELNKKLSMEHSVTAERPRMVDVWVNTDEDWTNLHSVIVDRMSYDAEVEKNKKLTKTIEELRYKKQDLQTTVEKMQKALEKNYGRNNKELEMVKYELKSCKKELDDLKGRYKELDEECETCAEYLRERDEQCRKLKEAKAALEAKLQEYVDVDGVVQSVRKKRQSLHDRHREPGPLLADAATETSDDLLSYQVEKDEVSPSLTDEKQMQQLKYLKTAMERLSQQKESLEQQLQAVCAAPMLVATGSAIVQNQQITDVLKENQKLKKMNAKLISICKKRGKGAGDRENEDPTDVR